MSSSWEAKLSRHAVALYLLSHAARCSVNFELSGMRDKAYGVRLLVVESRRPIGSSREEDALDDESPSPASKSTRAS